MLVSSVAFLPKQIMPRQSDIMDTLAFQQSCENLFTEHTT